MSQSNIQDRIYNTHTYGLDIDNFIIYLQGVEEEVQDGFIEPGVEYRMTNRFIKNLDILNGIDPNYPIIVSMKTCGGIWEEGIAIYSALKTIENPIIIINYTHARSMSSIIMQAADLRVMMPYSTFMYHFGDLTLEGTTKQVLTQAEFCKVSNKEMLDIYVEAVKNSGGKLSKKSKEQIRDWLLEEANQKENVFMTAAEAVRLGFADIIFEGWDDVIRRSKKLIKNNTWGK